MLGPAFILYDDFFPLLVQLCPRKVEFLLGSLDLGNQQFYVICRNNIIYVGFLTLSVYKGGELRQVYFYCKTK